MIKPTTTNARNIPWLQSIPERWAILSSKRLFTVRKDLALPGDEQLSATQAYGVIPQKAYEHRIGRKVTQITLHLEKRRHVERDDFVISMRSFEGGLERAWATGCIRSSYVVLRPSPEVHVGYFAHLFKSHDFIQALRATSNYIRDGQDLNFANFCLVDLPVVPMQEQVAIARFLDHIDRRSRRYIRAKQKLVKLLEEQKQAIIHRAVTRGLDPSVHLKPSGIDWLGDIPAHWEVSRVKNQFQCLNRRRIPLSATERGEMTLRLYDYYGASSIIDKVDEYLFDDDLLLIAEDGANLVLRNLPLAIIARGKFWVNNHAHVLKPKSGNLEYLSAVMEALNFRPWISGAAQPKLTQDRLMCIAIAVPEPNEQDRVIRHMQDETKSIRTSIDHTQREINLLREYRTRLIADVVTGKLDVRAAAASLPDEADEDLAAEAGLADEAEGLDDAQDGEAAGLEGQDEEVAM